MTARMNIPELEGVSPVGDKASSGSADPWAAFPLVEDNSGKSDGSEWDAFPLVDPTASQKIGTVAQGGTGAFVESAPIAAGMWMGAELGALGGPAAPLTIPFGALLGGAAGYLFGKEGRKVLSDVTLPGGAAVTYQNVEQLSPGLQPYGYAGEVLGASVTGGALPMVAARTGERLPPSVVGNWLNKIIDYAAINPGKFAAMEAGGAQGASVLGGVSYAFYPDNWWVQTSSEIVGGALNPTRLVVKSASTAADSMMRVVEGLSVPAQQTRAGKVLRDIIEASGGNVDSVITLLKESDLPGIARTSAQRTGVPALAVLEAHLRISSSKFGAETQKAAEDSLGAIENMITALRGTGDPEALRLAGELRSQYFRTLIAARVQDATSTAVEAAGRITADTPAARAEISRTAEAAVTQALDDARAAERELWNQIPRDVQARSDNLVRSYTEIREGLLPEESLPPVVEAFIRRLRGEPPQGGLPPDIQRLVNETFGPPVAPNTPPGQTTTGELIRFRSRALTLAREASAQGKLNDARVYGNLAEAALDDLSSVQAINAEYDAARQFSRELNDTFTRTFAGQAAQTNARGGQRIPPELLLERALGTGKTAGALRMEELTAATGFMQEHGGQSAQTLGTMLNAQERLLRLAAADAVDQTTGRINPTRVTKFLRDNEAMMERFPEVRTALESAVESEGAARGIEAMATRATRAIDNRAAFAQVAKVENPADAIRTAVNGKNPVNDLRAMIKLAERGGPEAADGLRGAIWDYATMKASGEWDSIYRNLFNPVRPGRPSLVEVMEQGGLMSAEEVGRLKTLFNEGQKIANAISTGNQMDEVMSAGQGLFDVLVRIAGARAGSALSTQGSSLIAASRGSEYAQQLFKKIPVARMTDLLMQAAKDPKFMAMLLEKAPSESARLANARQIHAYILQTGLATGEIEE